VRRTPLQMDLSGLRHVLKWRWQGLRHVL